MTDAPASAPAPERTAPWRGRKRVEEARGQFVAVRCTAAEHAALTEAAAKAGLSVGAYLRAAGLGSAGPRAKRRPTVERADLARALGLIGLYGSNLNQLARAANTNGETPKETALVEIARHVRDMRQMLRRALGRGD